MFMCYNICIYQNICFYYTYGGVARAVKIGRGRVMVEQFEKVISIVFWILITKDSEIEGASNLKKKKRKTIGGASYSYNFWLFEIYIF